MNSSLNDILIHLKSITGDSIIAWSVNYILTNEDVNEDIIWMMVMQIKDQINDNPTMMQEVLSPENYLFFDACNI